MSYPETLVFGTGRSRIALLPNASLPNRNIVRKLEGTFTWTQTSNSVATSEDQTTDLSAGDLIAASAAATKYYVVAAVSSSAITLASNFAETTISAGGAWQSIRNLVLPAASDIRIRYTPERFDGGGLMIRLSNGDIVQRANAWRPYVDMTFPKIERVMMKKIIDILNFGFRYPLMVWPHIDVPIKYRMRLLGDFAPDYPGGVYVAHNLSLSFEGLNLVASIPTASGAKEYYPLVI